MSTFVPSTRATRLPLALFALLSGWYLLTMSGHLYSSDEETMYAVTRRIALAGDVALEPVGEEPLAALRSGVDDRLFSPYGIVPSLLALPLFWVGGWLAPAATPAFDYATHLFVAALNGPVTAATAALLARWALQLGMPRAAAVAAALLYGLSTFAWPYARTFFSEPLTGLLLLGAAERAHAARQQPSPFWPAACSGLAAGLMLATRIAEGTVLPLIALLLLWPQASGPWRARLRRMFAAGAGWGAGLLPGLALLALYNVLRFGTPLATGYRSEAEAFITPIEIGLYGLLISPGKSVFLFAPPILLAVPGAVLLWRREPGLVLLALGLFAAHVLLYARWIAWSGGAWGPRFLLPALPMLILVGAALLSPAYASARARTTGWYTAGALGALGLAGSLGGVLVNFDTYLNMPVSETRRVYEPGGTPLIAHWQILADRVGRYSAPAPHCALAEGYFAPERRDAPFPRRTGPLGVVACRLDRPALIAIALNDGRTPEAPDSAFEVFLDGRDLGRVEARRARIYTMLLPPGSSTLELRSVTWNPARVGFGYRDDELGMVLTGLEIEGAHGADIPLIDRGIAPLPTQPLARFAWYYDRHNAHLVDHWAWYLARSELSPRRAWAMAALIVVASAGLLAAGRAALRIREPA